MGVHQPSMPLRLRLAEEELGSPTKSASHGELTLVAWRSPFQSAPALLAMPELPLTPMRANFGRNGSPGEEHLTASPGTRFLLKCGPVPDKGDVTQLLEEWSAGDQAALAKLMPLVYSELHRLARKQFRKE